MLHRLAGALSSARTPGEVLDVILAVPAASLRADAAFVLLLDEARGELWPVCDLRKVRSAVVPVIPCSIHADVPGAEAVVRRTPVLVGSPEALASRYPAIAPAASRVGYRAQAYTPLLTGRRVLGVLGLAFGARREFSPRDGHDLRAIGRYGGDALHRAELAESERNVRAEIASLSRRLVAAQEEERRRIARELHDEIGQALTLAVMVTTDPRRRPAESLADVRGTLEGLLERTRDLLNDLHPPMLAAQGLLPTLLQLFDRYRRQTYIEVQFTHRGLGRRYQADVEIAAFRIVQEALTNVARHADVHVVHVHVVGTPTRVRLEVADEGAGFAPAARRRLTSHGLPGMRERAVMLGGELTVESVPGRGTRVTADLPARPADPNTP